MNKVKFDGSVQGQRLKRSMFKATDEFSRTLTSAMRSSNSSVIAAVEEAGYVMQKKKRNVGKAKRRISMEEQVEVESRTVDHPEILKTVEEHYVGSYTVGIAILKEAPAKWKTREIDTNWVKTIQEGIMEIPGRVLTRLPVNIEKQDNQDFDPSMLNSDVDVHLLGGNHLVSAIKRIHAENGEDKTYDCLKTAEVDVYYNLSDDEAIFLASWHNLRTKQKKINFQDKVLLARNIYMRDIPSWKQKVAELIGCATNEKIAVQSLGCVLSVASYTEEEYAATKKLFEDYQRVTEPGSSFPQNLFKELQGVKSGRLSYLTRAEGTNGLKQARICREDKVRATYKATFQTLIQADSWEDAQKDHPEGCDRVEEIAAQERSAKRKYIPKELIDLAERCNNYEKVDDKNIQVDIRITIGNKEFTNNKEITEILKKHKTAIIKEIRKIPVTMES